MALGETTRTNEEWLEDLQASGTRADDAQSDLRALLAAVVRKSTSKSGALDENALDDLAQVALLRVLQSLDKFEGRSLFTTWAYSVAVRAALSELRKQSSYAAPTSDAALQQQIATDSQPESPMERREIVELLHRVIEQDLTERQRSAVVAQLHGAPTEQIATELGINRNALYKLFHDARLKLHAALCEAGICDDEVREAFDL